LQEAIAEMNDRDAEVIENGTAPFWRHVRGALAERYP
jgi:hypothetical protein